MSNARRVPARWIQSGLLCIAVGLASPHGTAETPPPPGPEQANVRELSNRFPDKPSIAPSWSLPVESLGFSAPGQNYLGMRNALATLDFLGENRILFTFRVPGLMHREPGSRADDQRQIRAVVLAVPSGTVQAQTDWTLHDRLHYLRVIDDDHFLLRDRETVFQVDGALNRKPLLHFPGPLLAIQLNPGGDYLLTNSQEPAEVARTASASATAAGADASSDAEESNQPDLVLRILRRSNSDVMLVTRVRQPIQLPFNADGYIGALRGNGVDWQIHMNYFSGQDRKLTDIKSACAPDLKFLSESTALATACSDSEDNALVAFTIAGSTLWTDLVTDRQIWPILITSRSGLRFARETLFVSHSVGASSPFGNDDVKGQWIQVFDSATGNLALEAPANPVLDVGGNVAISPSGRRVAILNGGSIQVFELPAPPAISTGSITRPVRP